MKLLLSLFILIICFMVFILYKSESIKHEIIINVARDTTIIITRSDFESHDDIGNGYEEGYFTFNGISGYSNCNSKLIISDVHINPKYEMVLDSGKIYKRNITHDFYAGKAMLDFKHGNSKKGQIILNVEF